MFPFNYYSPFFCLYASLCSMEETTVMSSGLRDSSCPDSQTQVDDLATQKRPPKTPCLSLGGGRCVRVHADVCVYVDLPTRVHSCAGTHTHCSPFRAPLLYMRRTVVRLKTYLKYSRNPYHINGVFFIVCFLCSYSMQSRTFIFIFCIWGAG